MWKSCDLFMWTFRKLYTSDNSEEILFLYFKNVLITAQINESKLKVWIGVLTRVANFLLVQNQKQLACSSSKAPPLPCPFSPAPNPLAPFPSSLCRSLSPPSLTCSFLLGWGRGLEGREVGAPAGGAGSGVGLGLRGLVCWRGLWLGLGVWVQRA